MGLVGLHQHVAGPVLLGGDGVDAKDIAGHAVDLVGQHLAAAGFFAGGEADLPDALIILAQQQLGDGGVILDAGVGKGNIAGLLLGQVIGGGQEVSGGGIAVIFFVPLVRVSCAGELLPEGVPSVVFPTDLAAAGLAVVVDGVHPLLEHSLGIFGPVPGRIDAVFDPLAHAVDCHAVEGALEGAGGEVDVPDAVAVFSAVEALVDAVLGAVKQGEVFAEVLTDGLSGQGSDLPGGHFPFGGEVHVIFRGISDLDHHLVEEMLFFHRPLVDQAAKGSAADLHDGLLFVVAFAHAERPHDGGIVVKEDAVFLHHGDEGPELLVGVRADRAHLAVIVLGQGDSLLFDDLLAGQKHGSHGGGSQQHQDDCQDQCEFHFAFHEWGLLSFGGTQNLLHKVRVCMEVGTVRLDRLGDLFLQVLVIHGDPPF